MSMDQNRRWRFEETSVAAGSLVSVTDDEHAALTAMIDAADDIRIRSCLYLCGSFRV